MNLFEIIENSTITNFQKNYNDFIKNLSQNGIYNLLNNRRFSTHYDKFIPHWQILGFDNWKITNEGLEISESISQGDVLKQEISNRILSNKYYTFYIRIKNANSKLYCKIEYGDGQLLHIDNLDDTVQTTLKFEDNEDWKEYRIYFKSAENLDTFSPIKVTICSSEELTLTNPLIIQEISFYEGYIDKIDAQNESIFELSTKWDDYNKVWLLTYNGKDYYRILVDDGYIDTKFRNLVDLEIENIKPIDLLNKIKEVDGKDSGLDADLLDGLDSSQFLRSDIDDIANGNIEFKKDITVDEDAYILQNLTVSKLIKTSDNLINIDNTDNENISGLLLNGNINAVYDNSLKTFRILNGTELQNIDVNETPTTDTNATSKKYVDTQDTNLSNTINDKIDNLTLQTIYNQTPKDSNNSASIKLNNDKSFTIYDENNNAIYFRVDAETGKVSLTGPVLIAGDLTVSGTTTTVNSQDTTVSDNILQLNEGETGDGVSKVYSGIEIERGTLKPTQLIWNENSKTWQVKVEDVYYNILVENLTDSNYAHINLDNVEDITLLNKLKNVDGSGSGLDADLLDGKDSSYYLDYSNATNTPTIGNGKITITNGTGISGSGYFSVNQTTDLTITISHGDTSTQGNTDNSDGSIIQNIELDTFGHITKITSYDFDNRFALKDLSNVTDSNILTKLKNVDGSGSGLDADLLDGLDSTKFLRTDITTKPVNDNSIDLGDSSHRFKSIYAVTFEGTAVEAEYADIAEKYIIPEEIENGSVIQVSSHNKYEGEICDTFNSSKVMGIVSNNPAFKMNSNLKNGKYIALKGRLPAKVFGKCNKGDILVSYYNGTLISINHNEVNKIVYNNLSFNIVGYALENKSTEKVEKIEIFLK